MNRFKNVLLVTMAVALVALAVGQYQTQRVAAGANENVYVVNSKEAPVPIVQASQWEYKLESCTGMNPSCLSFTLAGLQRWELVTVSRGRERGTLFEWNFVFKRPKL